jgi:hypothetical protein
MCCPALDFSATSFNQMAVSTASCCAKNSFLVTSLSGLLNQKLRSSFVTLVVLGYFSVRHFSTSFLHKLMMWVIYSAASSFHSNYFFLACLPSWNNGRVWFKYPAA